MSDPLAVGQRAPTLRAQPVFGHPVTSEAGRPLVVLFLRDLGSSTTRATVARVHASLGQFEAAAIPVVGITRTPLLDARDFVPRFHVLFPVVVDEPGEIFAAFGVGRDRGFLRTLRRLRPATIRQVLSSISAGRGLPREGYDQLPAFFVIGADGALRYARYADTVLEQPDMDAIWQCASG